MKQVHESSVEPKRVAGSKGWVDLFDILTEPLILGVRVIPPHSEIPTRKHAHSEAQVTYVLSGKPKITNTRITLQLQPGDFVVLGPNEEHYVYLRKAKSACLK